MNLQPYSPKVLALCGITLIGMGCTLFFCGRLCYPRILVT